MSVTITDEDLQEFFSEKEIKLIKKGIIKENYHKFRGYILKEQAAIEREKSEREWDEQQKRKDISEIQLKLEYYRKKWEDQTATAERIWHYIND